MGLVFGLATGKYPLEVAVGSTSWRVISSDGNAYASVAALLAAGKQPFPKSDGTIGLDLGMKLQSVTLSTSSAGAPGSAFYVAFNPQTAPSGTAGEFVEAGIYFNETGHVSQLWVSLTASSDVLQILARY